MVLYYPIDNRTWEIHTIESDKLHFLYHSSNGYDVYNRLTIINGRKYSSGELCYSDRIFTSINGCQAYINKDYGISNKYLYFKGDKIW